MPQESSASEVPPPPRIWKTGEQVKISYSHPQKTVVGSIMLASENGKSLMLSFDAMLGGYAGMMPVMWCGERGFRCLVCGNLVTLEPTVTQ